MEKEVVAHRTGRNAICVPPVLVKLPCCEDKDASGQYTANMAQLRAAHDISGIEITRDASAIQIILEEYPSEDHSVGIIEVAGTGLGNVVVCLFVQSFVAMGINLLRWNDVPRTSRIFCPRIAIFS